MDIRQTASLDLTNSLLNIAKLEQGILQLQATASRPIKVGGINSSNAAADLKALEAGLKRLQGTTTIRITAPNTTGISAQLASFTRSTDQNARALQNLFGQVTLLFGPLGSLGSQVAGLISGFQGMSAAELGLIVPTATLTAGFIALGAAVAASVAEAIPFEAGLAQLRSLAGLSQGDISDLGKEFQDLSTKLPLASTELIEIGRNAVLAGVHGKKELGEFVEIGAQLGVLLRNTDGHAEDLEGTMRELAKFLNAAGIAGEAFIPALRVSGSELITLKSRVGGTIPEILSMSSYLVSMGTKLGLSTEEVLALSSAIASTGGKAQASGHAIARIIEDMQEASIHGGEAADNYAKLLGLTADQFKELVLNNPAAAFKQLAGSIDETTKNGASIANIFDTLGIKNVRLKQTIAEAAVAFPKLSGALDIAAQAQAHQGDLADRAAIATANFRDRMKEFRDSIQSALQVFGLRFLPKMTEFIDKAKLFTDGARNIIENGAALKDYAYAGATAVGVLTTAMLLNSKAAQAMFAADALAATGGGLKTFLGAVGPGLVNVASRFTGVITGFRTLSEAAKLEGAATGIRGFFQVLSFGAVSSAAVLTGIVVSLGLLAAYTIKILGDVAAINKQTEDGENKAFEGTLDRVAKLRAAGDQLSLQKARVLLAQQRLQQTQQGDVVGSDFAGNAIYKVDPTQVATAQKYLSDQQAKLAEVRREQDNASMSAVILQGHTRETGEAAHHASEMYGELSVKLTDLSRKFGEAKMTTFESNLKGARDELERFTAEVDRAYKAGNVSGDERKSLLSKASGLQDRTAQTLVQRQLDEDTKTRVQHERDVQDAQLALIKDARLKRQGELRKQLDDVKAAYAEQISEALKNARAAPDPVSRRKFQDDAGKLQVQQAEQERALRSKAAQDLDEIDQDRLQKALDAQKRLLEGQSAGYGEQLKQLQLTRDQELALAGESAEGRLAIEQRYGPLLLKLQKEQARLSQQSQLQTLADTYQQQIKAAETAGPREAELRLTAQQEYVQGVQNLELSTQNSTNAATLEQEGRVRAEQLKIYQDMLDKRLAGLKDFSGKELAAARASLQADRTRAVAAGDSGKVAAIDKGLGQITDQERSNLVAFRGELTKARDGAVDLRTQLANIAQTPLEKALSGAVSPFNTVLKGAADNVKSLQAAFGKLSNADQQGRNGASLRAQLAEQNRIILAANQGRNQALLTAQQAFDRELADKAAGAALKLGKTRFDAEVIGEGAYTRALDADRAYWQARLKVAAQGSADEDAVLQHLADNQAERDRARQVIQTRTADTRNLQREELQGSLDLARTDADRARLRQGLLAIDAARLAQVNAEIRTLKATGGKQEDINALKRERLTLQGNINTAQQQERTLTDELVRSQLSLTGAEQQRQAAMARSTAEVAAAKAAAVQQSAQELADTDRRIAAAVRDGKTQADVNALLTERAGKVTALYQAQRDAARYGVEVSQQQLDLDEARERAMAQITGLADDAVASAVIDLDVTQRQIGFIDQQLADRDKLKLADADINALQVKRLTLLGQEAEQQRKIVEAQRQRRDLIEGVNLGAGALQREVASGSPGNRALSDAEGNIADTRVRLAQATRAYSEAQADLNESQSTTSLQKFASAQEALTSRIADQRKSVAALASAYRDQLSSMDSVRDATEKLRGTVPSGTPDGKIAQGEEGQAYERLYAIQARRDQALRQVQDAIQSGDAKVIASTTQELTTQQARYNKQAELLKKNGLQLTPSNNQALQDTLKQLDRLGITYDQEAVHLQQRADAADKESQAAVTFSSATDRLPDIFKTGAQQIQDAICRGVNFMLQSLPRTATVTTPSVAGAIQTFNRGGDTITYQVENHIHPSPGQQLSLDDVTRAVDAGIDRRRDQALQRRAWTPSTCKPGGG